MIPSIVFFTLFVNNHATQNYVSYSRNSKLVTGKSKGQTITYFYFDIFTFPRSKYHKKVLTKKTINFDTDYYSFRLSTATIGLVYSSACVCLCVCVCKF